MGSYTVKLRIFLAVLLAAVSVSAVFLPPPAIVAAQSCDITWDFSSSLEEWDTAGYSATGGKMEWAGGTWATLTKEEILTKLGYPTSYEIRVNSGVYLSGVQNQNTGTYLNGRITFDGGTYSQRSWQGRGYEIGFNLNYGSNSNNRIYSFGLRPTNGVTYARWDDIVLHLPCSNIWNPADGTPTPTATHTPTATPTNTPGAACAYLVNCTFDVNTLPWLLTGSGEYQAITQDVVLGESADLVSTQLALGGGKYIVTFDGNSGCVAGGLQVYFEDGEGGLVAFSEIIYGVGDWHPYAVEADLGAGLYTLGFVSSCSEDLFTLDNIFLTLLLPTATVTATPLATATLLPGFTPFPTPTPYIDFSGQGIPTPFPINDVDIGLDLNFLWELDGLSLIVSIIRTIPVLMSKYNLIYVVVFFAAAVLAIRWISGFVARRQENI